MNLVHVVALILGSVIGSGVFINIPIVARETGSPLLMIIAWAVGGLLWLPQIFIVSELATAYPDEGFGYLYLKKAGSPALGFLYVWTVFLTSDTPSITIIAMSAVSALSAFWRGFNDPMANRILASLIIVVFTYVHYKSVRKGGNLQVILTVLKLSPLFLLILLGFTNFNTSNFSGFFRSDETHGVFYLLVGGVSATVWSYAGFTNVLYMAGEMKNPHKTIPLANIFSVVFVTLFYSLIALSTVVLIPFEDIAGFTGQFLNPFAYLPSFSKIASYFLSIAAFTSMVGCISALIMVQPRIEYAIARDGLFFKPFAHVHPRYNTPDLSIIFQSGLAICLVFIGGIESLLGYFTISYLAQNALVYGTIFILRKKRDYKPAFRSPAWIPMALLAIITQLYLAYGTFIAYPVEGVVASLLIIGSGVPIYLYFKKKGHLSP